MQCGKVVGRGSDAPALCDAVEQSDRFLRSRGKGLGLISRSAYMDASVKC